ncbi:MAG: sigma-70 family RNA polymerase sigma factor [Myxococcales bacterium]|nr:sigma-70 family RNA polymerase sigma factor [Myxococcales bacterium]
MEREVRAAAGGDQQAFAGLVDATSSMVWAVLRSAGHDHARTQELAQEVYLTAWQRLPTLREPAAFVTWLRGIARNKALHQARTLARRRRWEVVGEADLPASEPPPTDEMLQLCLERLPAPSVEVLTLYYWEERSTEEVARQLDLSEAAVRQRLVRARKQIEREWPTVEAALSLARPGPAFTALVVAGLGAGLAEATATAGPISVGAAGAALALLLIGWATVTPNAPAASEPAPIEIPAEAPAPLPAATTEAPVAPPEPANPEPAGGSEPAVAEAAPASRGPLVWMVQPPSDKALHKTARKLRKLLPEADLELAPVELALHVEDLLRYPNESGAVLTDAQRARFEAAGAAGPLYLALTTELADNGFCVWEWSAVDGLVRIEWHHVEGLVSPAPGRVLFLPWLGIDDPAPMKLIAADLPRRTGVRNFSVETMASAPWTLDIIDAVMLHPYDRGHELREDLKAELRARQVAGEDLYVAFVSPRHPKALLLDRWDGSVLRTVHP